MDGLSECGTVMVSVGRHGQRVLAWMMCAMLALAISMFGH